MRCPALLFPRSGAWLVHRALLLFLLFSGTAWGQAAPDAGSLQQQLDRERTQTLPPRTAPFPEAAPPSTAPRTPATLTVTAFRFSGNRLLDSERLAPAVAAFLNRPIDYAQLQQAVAAVGDTYRRAGWVVRVFLPAQEISSGEVTIQVVEAIYGGALPEGAPPRRVELAQVLSLLAAQQQPGQPLNADALDRGLLLADDLPGVSVAGSLQAGARNGQTDVALRVEDEALAQTDLVLDNSGARSTGRARLGANLGVNSPLGRGELIAINALHTAGSDYLRASLSVPLGADGWRAGLNASHLGYHLVAPEFAALNAKGSFDAAGLEASYPLIRSRLKNLYFNTALDRKRFDNLSADAVTSRYRASVLTLGLAGNLFDNLGGGGANSASLALTVGTLDLAGSPNQGADTATTRAAGHYAKLRYGLTREQELGHQFSLYAALSGQWAAKNLDSSEKFYLGGAGGVRAYPNSEGGGAQASLLNLELRRRLREGLRLAAFYDFGRVTVNRDNAFSGATAVNTYSLKGAGLSLSWLSGRGSTLRGTWARRIGANPAPAANGNDQDGTLIKDRLWLAAGVSF